MNLKNGYLPFLAAFIVLFALFSALGFLLAGLDWTWAKILICIVVVSGATLAWSWLKKSALAQSFHEVGFGAPDWRAVGLAVAICVLMLLFFPIYSSFTKVELNLHDNWPWILLGIIAGVGIAEETLFRGFAFNFLRERLSFWKAATFSMILFGIMHLLLLLWLPLPIAIAAIILAVISSYPTAYLFEKGNRTIWPSAILHSAALSTNLFEVPAEITVTFSLLWIAVILICLPLVFLGGRLLFQPSRSKLAPNQAG